MLLQGNLNYRFSIPDSLFQIPRFEPGQELVDPRKPTLVHEDRPTAVCRGLDTHVCHQQDENERGDM